MLKTAPQAQLHQTDIFLKRMMHLSTTVSFYMIFTFFVKNILKKCENSDAKKTDHKSLLTYK